MTDTIRSWRRKSGQKGVDLNTCTEISTMGKMSQRFPSLCLQALIQLRKRLPGFQATTYFVMIGGYLDSCGSCWRFLRIYCSIPRLLITIPLLFKQAQPFL